MRFFNRVSLSTPESVELEFTLAGIGSRTLALVIDYNILMLILVGFWLIWLIVFWGLASYFEGLGWNYSQLPLWLLAIAMLGTFTIYNGYFVYFEVMWQGQSPGKRFTKIRVVRDNGRPVGLSQAVIRSLLRTIDDICFVGALFILFGKQEKRIGDWAAGTIVIQQDQPSTMARSRFRRSRTRQLDSINPAMIAKESHKLAAQLPEIADLSQVLPDDFAVIREYLRRRSSLEANARLTKSMQLADQLRSIIHLAVIPPDTTSDHFIEAVYLAYQAQTNRPS